MRARISAKLWIELVEILLIADCTELVSESDDTEDEERVGEIIGDILEKTWWWYEVKREIRVRDKATL